MSQTHNDRSTEQGAKVNSMDGQEGATLAPPAFKLTATGQNPGGNPAGGTAQLQSAPPKTAVQKGTVITATLKVRSGPGPENSAVKPSLSLNAKVDILESKNGWLRIGEGKWVSADFVLVEGAALGGSAKAATPAGKKGEWDFKKLSDDLDKVLSMTGFKQAELYKVISELPKNSAEAAAFIEFYNSIHNGDLAKELQKQLQGEALQKAIAFLDITKSWGHDESAKTPLTKTKPAPPKPITIGNFKLSNSVGLKGVNLVKDVKQVQDLLLAFKYLSEGDAELTLVQDKLAADSSTKLSAAELPNTIAAIIQYQQYGFTKGEKAANRTTNYVKGDGTLAKGGGDVINMAEMARLNDKLSGTEIAEEDIPTILSESQWRSQIRYGANFGNGQDAKEQEYMDFVKAVTGFSEAGQLMDAPKDQIKKVQDVYGKVKWNTSADLRGHSITSAEKARREKPNLVCCWDAAMLMLRSTGATEKGTTTKIQTYVQEATGGTWTPQVELGIKYLDSQLKAGKVIFVGMDKGKTDTINEGTTDHFVVIVGKHKDGDRWYYHFFDPGSDTLDKGVSQSKNRMYIGADKKSIDNKDRGYMMSQIHVNNEK